MQITITYYIFTLSIGFFCLCLSFLHIFSIVPGDEAIAEQAKRQHSVMQDNTHSLDTLCPSQWDDYALIDSGHGRKLERFGRFHFIRPEPQALWAPHFDASIWDKADGVFSPSGEEKGQWKCAPHLPERWEMRFENLRFNALPTPFRHLGFFPEQSPHWQWTAHKIEKFIARYGRAPKILNLFAYSGLASLHAAQAGAEVTHIDASKKAIALAFENRGLSDMENAPIRFITEDAGRFVEKEVKRNKKYDGIMLDPPKYGRGPKGEIWQLNDDLPGLLAGCRHLLSDEALLFIVTIYAIRTSTNAIRSAIADLLEISHDALEAGELAIAENREQGRMIGQALYARWSSL